MTGQERADRDYPEGFFAEASVAIHADPVWRVGRHQRQNLYAGDRYAGVMFHEDDAARVVEAMTTRAPAPAGAGGLTVVSVAREIEDAMTAAGLDGGSVYVTVHLMPGHPTASVLKVDGLYTATEADRLAAHLAPDAAYRGPVSTGDDFGVLDGTTRSGVRVSIHCEPRAGTEPDGAP